MAGLLGMGRDTLQAASNAIAGNVSGPVDLINSGLLAMGLPMPAAPFGGSRWMAERGLTREVANPSARVVGETLGLLGPIVAAAKAPQIASGLLAMADNAMAPTPIKTATRGQGGALYFRRTRGGPDNGTGHMMFAKHHDSVRHYGSRLHTFNDAAPAAAGRIADASDPAFQKKVAAALRNDPDIVAEYGRANISKLIAEANPDNIVNSAGLWDNLGLTEAVWNKVLAPSGIHAVRTSDGAVVFNPDLVRTRAVYPPGR